MSHPTPMFGTQNINDDDAVVIDSYTQEINNPPDMESAEQPIPPTPADPIPVTTKIITGEIILRPGWDPVQILTDDKNRLQLHIRVISATSVATDGIRIASTKDQARTGGRIMSGQTSGAIDNHTGAVWVYGATLTDTPISADLNVEYWAVTK